MSQELPPEIRLQLAREIEAKILSPIAGDEAQAISLLAERVRLSLYGSLAILAAACSGLVALDRQIEHWMIAAGLISLAIGATIAWNAHAHLEIMAHQRVVRRTARFQDAMAKTFPNDPLCPPIERADLDRIVDDELSTGRKIRSHVVWSTSLATFGTLLLLSALANSFAERKDFPEEPEAKPAVAGPVSPSSPGLPQ